MRHLALAAGAAAALTACGSDPAAAPTGLMDAPTQRPGWIDVTLPPYSARGDGVTDDTGAFQRALSETGAAGGGVVFAPTGTYRVKTHLSIPPSTMLKGVFFGPSEVDLHTRAPVTTGPGSMLLAEEGAGSDSGRPFVSLDGHDAAIDGFIIFYPNQISADPPTKYPFTIGVGTDPGPDGPRAQNATIQNVTLANSYNGIDLGTNESTRHYVNNVYGEPANIGIFVDKCFDNGRIENVQFNGNWASGDEAWKKFSYENGVAFLFYRSDAELMSNIVAWGYHVGMQFEHSPGHDDWSSSALISNVGLENTDLGILAKDAIGGVTIENLDWASPPDIGTYRTVVWLPTGGARYGAGVSLVNATIANGYRRLALLEQPAGWFSMVASKAGPSADTSMPYLDILAGQAIVSANNFPLGSAAYALAHVGPLAAQVVITDNIIGLGTITVDSMTTRVVNQGNLSVK
jgi:hypothetical protein